MLGSRILTNVGFQKVDENSSETRKRKPSSELGQLINEAPKGLKNLISKAVDIKCEPNLQELTSRQPKERKKVSGDKIEVKETSKTKEIEKSEKKKSKEKKSRDREREKSHEESKSRKIDVADSSIKRPEKRKLSASSVSDFSKRKIADSRSDDSAQLLRPTKEKSKLRNPALDLIARHRESGKFTDPSQSLLGPNIPDRIKSPVSSQWMFITIIFSVGTKSTKNE